MLSRYVIWVLALLLTCLPLSVLLLTPPARIYSFVDTSFFYLAVSALTVTVFVAVGKPYGGVITLTISHIDVSLFCIICAAALSLLLNGYMPWYDDSFRLLFISITLFGIYRIFLRRRHINILIYSLLATNLLFLMIHSSMWFIQYIYNGYRISSFLNALDPFRNTGIWGNYLSSLLPFSLVLARHKTSNAGNFGLRLLAVLNVAVILYILPLTQARTAWIGSSLGCLFAFWDEQKFIGIRYRFYRQFTAIMSIRRFTLLSISGITIAVIIGAWTVYTLKPNSADGRILIYNVCGTMFMDAPLIGFGWGKFRAVYGLYQAQYFRVHTNNTHFQWLADNVPLAYNEFLNVALEIGIVGLLCFCMLVYSLFRGERLQKGADAKSQMYSRGAIASLISIFACAMFSYPFHTLPIVINFVLLAAILVETKPITIVYSWSIKPLLHRNGIILFLCIIIIGIQAMLWYEVQILSRWREAAHQAEYGRFNHHEYEICYPILRHNGYFLYNYGAQLFLNAKYKDGLRLLVESKHFFVSSDAYMLIGQCYENIGKYPDAEYAYITASQITPNKIYPHYALAKLYQILGKDSNAVHSARKVVSMNMKVITSEAILMKSEMKTFLDSSALMKLP